jgi:hypothetical protein
MMEEEAVNSTTIYCKNIGVTPSTTIIFKKGKKNSYSLTELHYIIEKQLGGRNHQDRGGERKLKGEGNGSTLYVYI